MLYQWKGDYCPSASNIAKQPKPLITRDATLAIGASFLVDRIDHIAEVHT